MNDIIALSASLRVTASGAPGEHTPRAEFELSEANIQVETRLIADVLAAYVDQTLGPGSATAREAFAIVEQLPLEGFVKLGKFLLPYGIRLADDQEFIRQRTGFNYNMPDMGIEAGIEPGRLSLFLALTNGTQSAPENNSAKQLTGTASVVYPGFRVGASASRNQGTVGRRDALGAFSGFRLGRFTALGELDFISDHFDTGPDIRQFAAYLEGDFLMTRGVNAKVTYGYLDPDADIGENARIRMRFGIEGFPVGFLQVSAFYTLLQDIPQATTDIDRLAIQLHLHF